MTDMKLAVVPYTNDPDEPAGMLDPEYVGVTHDEAAYVLYGKGKLTREQIENMAREFYNHIQGKGMVHLLYCDEEVEIFIEAMRKAALLVGFGVEGE